MNDLQVDRQHLVRRFSGAEFAAARERPALDAFEQLLHVETRDRAAAARQAGRAVETFGQVVDAAAGAVDRQSEIAFALEPPNAEHLAETLFEIDIGELQLGLEISPARRLGEPERAFDDPSEGLGFADRDCEIAAPQIGRHRRAPELGAGDVDAGGREPEVDMHAVEAIERNRLAVPAALAARQQTDRGNVWGEIEPFGRQGPLQGLPPVEREHALGGIAVEFDIDPGQAEGAADDIGLRLEREAAETTPRRRLLFRPTQRVAQGCGVGGKGAFHLERRPMADVAVERNLERCSCKPDLEAGPVAVQGGDEVGKADGGVDRLVMPGEASGRGEAARDRRPGERHFHVRERLDDLVRLVAQDDGAVLDPDLRE